MSNPNPNQDSLTAYYRWHARIYDLTRWTFLFGRREIIFQAACRMPRPARILEVGCGTGRNLVDLAERFPAASVTGLDLSLDMLDRARAKVERFGSRVTLLHRPYDAPVADGGKFDLIILSYALSMINPGYDEVLRLCKADLSATGVIAVVDFHQSRCAWFRRWMAVNHVRMEGQILAELDNHYRQVFCQARPGYGCLWRYFLYLGK